MSGAPEGIVRRTIQKIDFVEIARDLLEVSVIVTAVRTSFAPFSFVVIAIAGWMSRHQQEVIA